MKLAQITIIRVCVLIATSVTTTVSQTFVSADVVANGGCPSLSNPSSTAMIAIPGLVATNSGYLFDIGWERKFQLKELDRMYLSTSMTTSFGSMSVGFDQFGLTDLYSEKTARLTLSHSFGNVGGGILLEGSQVSFARGYQSLSKASVGCGISASFSKLAFAIAGYDLNSPSYDSHSPATPRNGRIYAEYSGANRATASAYLGVTEKSKPQFGFGQRLSISESADLLFGAETLPTEYSAGLLFSHGKSLFSYAATYHADLGISHLMSIGFGLGH